MIEEIPMVSVCVQTYQHGEFIHECLTGILTQQTSFPFEVLIGEDNSTDGTREITIEYAEKYPDKVRIFLHDRSNVIYVNGIATGRYNFLNNVKNAKGKYIAMCEGDDYWTDPRKLEKQIEFLEKNEEYSVCYHRCSLSDPDLKADNQSSESYSFSFWESLQRKNGYTLSMVFRADAIRNKDLAYYFKDLLNGDWALECLLTLNKKGYYMKELMGCYRIHDSGLSKKLNVENFINTRLLFMSRIRIVTGEKYQDYINACMGRLYILRMKQLLGKREIWKMLLELPRITKRIIQYKPWYQNEKVVWIGRYKIL